jgi:hypothetical protein
MQDPQRFNIRASLLWTAGFLSFPIAGIAAEAVVGRIDDAGSALVGGLVAGAVIGTGQWLVARRLLDAQTWIPATAVAMGVGLLVGAWVVGYGTSLGELALMGFITGIPLRRPGVSASRSGGQCVGLGSGRAAAVGAWLDGDHRRRHRCRAPVRGLRRLGGDHLHGPVRGAVGPAPRGRSIRPAGPTNRTRLTEGRRHE